jgi:hypothetical protein
VVRPKRDALIDRTERASVDRLLALVRKGGIDVPAAEGPSAAPQELALAPVVVKELEVPLLPFGGGSDDPQAVRR